MVIVPPLPSQRIVLFLTSFLSLSPNFSPPVSFSRVGPNPSLPFYQRFFSGPVEQKILDDISAVFRPGSLFFVYFFVLLFCFILFFLS